ncbi:MULTISPECIES: pyridoxal kinase [Ochrobactrum]|uniref:pyridoxal kinase n=1 Tax=Ochrobactrum chromiisoli TaxID=2993941 RepID=A0ABT3QU24_9HYPH|nr:pyridoxal kinase [Ochrobactrum chromiisoli]MCX2699130.1 pyridoxal kinase [Ochrobactrum chromiisoli]
MNIISIQSQVVHGHVGNSAAVLPMQVRGLTVAAVPTTLLSNNPHFETMRGRVLESELVGDLLRGVEERGLIETSRYIISGYLGSRANGDVVAAFVERARRINPDIVYICDPVMGDSNLGVFVADQVVECLLGRLVPMADVLTPNQFEVGLIAGSGISSWRALEADVLKIQAQRQARLVVTGCTLADTPDGLLENIVFENKTSTRLTFPRLPIAPVGTGDLFTGLLTANLAHGGTLVDAARGAGAVVLDVLERTIASGQQEMRLASVIDALLPGRREALH